MKRLAILAITSLLPHLPLAAGEQTAREFKGTAAVEASYRYLLSLPDGYEADKEKKWPLLIFLHGAGERGSDLEMLKKHGPPKLIESGKKFEAIVASPQCLPEEIWVSHGIKALADHLVKEHRVDTSRIYITGLSMGGFGTWETIMDYPNCFAAAIPICGGAGVRWVMAERIKHVPVWIFHGDKDTAVTVDFSKKMNDALTKAGGNVKMTIYPGVGHDSWTATYNNEEVWQWLFSQKLGSR